MALQSFNGKTAGVTGLSQNPAGISHVTQYTQGHEYGNISRAKDSSGELASIFMSKGVYTSEITGYSNTITAPDLGTNLAGPAGSQKVMSSQIQASNQDFVKVTVTGRGIG